MHSLCWLSKVVFFWSLTVFVSWGCPCFGDEGVEEMIRQLAASRSKDVRLGAMKRLGEVAKNRATLVAIPALVDCLKDLDPDIRSRALYSLAEIGAEHEQTCPMEIFELLSDPDENVRDNAWMFTTWH